MPIDDEKPPKWVRLLEGLAKESREIKVRAGESA